MKKKIVVALAVLFAVACKKTETPKENCWSCNLQDPLSGSVDHKDSCTRFENPPIVLYVDGVPYSASCVKK